MLIPNFVIVLETRDLTLFFSILQLIISDQNAHRIDHFFFLHGISYKACSLYYLKV